MLSIALFFPFSFAVSDGWVALAISAPAAFGLAAIILRLYRSLFWEVTFDTARQMVELRRRGRAETVALGHIIGFQICRCIDKKTTGFFRYSNEFHQLILVYEEGGGYHRRLITASTSGESARLASRLAGRVKIDVKHYAHLAAFDPDGNR